MIVYMTSFNSVQNYEIGIFLFIDTLRNILVAELASLVIFYVLFSLIFGWSWISIMRKNIA